MITIAKVALDQTTTEQRIKVRGALRVIGLDIDGKEKKPYFYVIIDTAYTNERTCILYLVKDGQDARCLLKNPKFIDSSRGYHLFSEGILPRPPQITM